MVRILDVGVPARWLLVFYDRFGCWNMTRFYLDYRTSFTPHWEWAHIDSNLREQYALKGPLTFDEFTYEYIKLLKETMTDKVIPTEAPASETGRDPVTNPSHYKGIQPIDVMRNNFTRDEFRGFLKGNVLKYVMRYQDKGGLDDLKKAEQYLKWLIDFER